MKITGIISEYNPLHLGHKKQFDLIHKQNPDDAIVCLMSGNFVQRGAPAIIDKAYRAKAAILAGADLILELPIAASLSSAEGFAQGGVDILGKFCSNLCFGAETNDTSLLMNTAIALGTGDFKSHLRVHLDAGLSFPAARQKALEAMGLNGEVLSSPNNILAVEYCKAILTTGTPMQPMVIRREGNYHDDMPDTDNPSATAIRALMERNRDWAQYVPNPECFADAMLHTLCNGEQAILYRLKTMTDAEFEALPYGSEGLWRKLMHNSRKYNTLEEIITATKSKRYTRTRLDRMVMCAFLGITSEMLSLPAPYINVLAFNDIGREALKLARQTGNFINIGENTKDPYTDFIKRCDDLYELFSPVPAIQNRKVYVHK